MTQNDNYNGLEIAVIGMAAQFPGSQNCQAYWNNLKEGKDLIKQFTPEELLASGVSEKELSDPNYLTSFGLLEGKENFDHIFFGYTADEARLMDPQTRLFHENCWSALEDSGYSGTLDKVKVGLFAGASENDNWKIYVNQQSKKTAVDPFLINSISNQSFIHSLISYKLNLRGPSYYVNTACSTSLVAVHLACRSLLTKECTIALAGGVSLQTIKKRGYYYREGMIVSKDGVCRAFDGAANGTTVGEGAGIVVLKRLSEAIKDQDHIYAVIKATAVNNDGNHKVGYTAPSVRGQAECIRSAQRLGGIDPRSISYVEGHGTATTLGDPIEIRALNEAFAVAPSEKYCAIGSVKTNMGHLNAAAGIAGLIKTILSVKNRLIPPSLHFTSPNPEIDFANGPFYVNTGLNVMKPQQGFPLRAGVSSFGIGGTNAHVIIEDAPVAEPEAGRNEDLLVISAKNTDSLRRYQEKLKQFITDDPELNLSNLSYTLQTGRKHFQYRKSFRFTNRAQLLTLLTDSITDQEQNTRKSSKEIAFMFSGQGTQYAAMGKGLYGSEKVFREEMDKGFEILEKLTNEDFKTILFYENADLIDQTQYAQPLLFLLEYALCRLMMSIGVLPNCLIGHSLGEYTAATISGVFSFEEAISLVVKRGSLMETLPAGKMISIAINEIDVAHYLDEKISVAAVNGDRQVVLSGDPGAIEVLTGRLNNDGIGYRVLNTKQAFHSAMIEPILTEFRSELSKMSFGKPLITMISNLSGDVAGEEISTPEYWLNHMRQTVKFSAGIKNIRLKSKEYIFVEIGPGRTLSTLLKGLGNKAFQYAFNLLPFPTEKETEAQKFLFELGKLWTAGVEIDWRKYYNDRIRRKISAPTYSFEPYKHPTEVDPFKGVDFLDTKMSNFSNGSFRSGIYIPVWKRSTKPFADRKNTNRVINFTIDSDHSKALTATLTRRGNNVTEIYIGKAYAKERGNYTVNPDHQGDLSRILNEILIPENGITDIIYGWGWAIDPSGIHLVNDNPAINLAYFNLVKIIQSLKPIHLPLIGEIFLLTDRLHKVIGNEHLRCEQALLMGLMSTLPQEYKFACVNLDVDLSSPADSVAEVLSQEISFTAQGRERVIALRNNYRWLQEYDLNVGEIISKSTKIFKGGRYLITGGLGNLGYLLAKYLITAYGAKVIVTGRAILEHTGSVSKSIKESRFKELINLDPDTIYLNIDVSSRDDLGAAIKETEKSSGQIRGLIHTAAATDTKNFELISSITYQNALEMFTPKIQGIKNLYEIFKDRDLDFAWITSSISSIIGGVGFASYSAANSFMEHFLYAKQEELPGWKCLGLSAMQFEEDAAQTDEPRPFTLTPEEIKLLFATTVGIENEPLLIQSIQPLPALIEKTFLKKDDRGDGKGISISRNLKRENQEVSSEFKDPETQTERQLSVIFEEYLGLEGIGIEDDFFELGGDSLKGMMILRKIKNQLNVNLPLKEFFTQATIREVAANIDAILWQATEADTNNEVII